MHFECFCIPGLLSLKINTTQYNTTVSLVLHTAMLLLLHKKVLKYVIYICIYWDVEICMHGLKNLQILSTRFLMLLILTRTLLRFLIAENVFYIFICICLAFKPIDVLLINPDWQIIQRSKKQISEVQSIVCSWQNRTLNTQLFKI